MLAIFSPQCVSQPAHKHTHASVRTSRDLLREWWGACMLMQASNYKRA